VIGERRLAVIGLHTDIDDSSGSENWGAATERLLCRMALMRTCGLSLTRISLAGGSAALWLAGGAQELTAVASAIDEALDEGCARWRLPRPAITVAPLRP
jgi:diaminopimelate decarboxylase